MESLRIAWKFPDVGVAAGLAEAGSRSLWGRNSERVSILWARRVVLKKLEYHVRLQAAKLDTEHSANRRHRTGRGA